MIDEKLCRSCKHRFEPEHQSTCWACHDNKLYVSDEPPKTKRRMTNFEKIKKMSVEEMACFLLSIFDEEDGCITIEDRTMVCNPCAVEGWLESEVDDEQ